MLKLRAMLNNGLVLLSIISEATASVTLLTIKSATIVQNNLKINQERIGIYHVNPISKKLPSRKFSQ